MRPRAAISQKGESLAVWRGLDDKMHYATSASGKAAFSAPHEIVNPSETLDDQIVAFAPSGAAVVAWKGSFHVYAAVRDPGGSFAPTQGVEAESCSGGDFHAAIDDAGAAVLDWSSDWRRLSSEKECEVGGTPTWLRAAYRAPGHSFDAPVNAAEMDGWSDAGGVTVSGTGRATISAKGWMLSPSSPSYETALTRLPDGSYGDAQTIVREAPVEEPALLAEDAVGDLYSVAGVRTYEEMGEPGDAGPVSGMLANLAPAGGGFAAEAASLLTGRGEFFSAPVIAAAGREHAATAWQAGRRIELSDIQPGEPPANPSETPLPAPVVPPVGTGSTDTGLTGSSTVTDGKAVAGASGGVAGTIATRAAAHLPVTEPRLTVTGRSDRAIAVSVRLLSRGRVIRSVHARLLRGRFTARIEITGLAPGHYRLEIVRRRGTRQHTEDRAVNVG
jgi:hypothetical protein